MLFKRIVCAAILVLSPFYIQSVENVYPESGVETFILENGMKVALKQTDNEPGEVLVRLMAEGGFAELPVGQQTAGKISSEAAVRSGLSDFGFDKMHAMLYQHSIEFETRMQPFSRSMELSADSDELEQLFNVVNLFFTKSRFSHQAYDAHKKQLAEVIKDREADSFKQLDDEFMEFNTQQFHAFQLMKVSDIENASFDQSERFFKRCFVNPADFVFVIVGDFDIVEAKRHIQQYLGKIPINGDVNSPKIPRLPDFTKGIRSKVVKNPHREQAITRMTFPLQVAVKQDNVRELEVLSCLIKERLVKKVVQQIHPIPEVRVSLDFPYYPSFHSSWVTIQYISDAKQVSSTGQSILLELKRMQIEGFSQEEMNKVKKCIESSDNLAQLENLYWLTQIANFIVWEWDLSKLSKDFANGPYWSLKEANKNMASVISMDNYTIISQQP